MKSDFIRRRSNRALILAASTVFAGIVVPVAVGQTYTYTGPSGGNWSTTTNWTSSTVPGSSGTSDTAQLGGGSGTSPVSVNFNYSYDAAAPSSTSSTHILSELYLEGTGVANGLVLNQTLATSYMAATDENIGYFSPNGTTYSQSNGANVATNELNVGGGATAAGDGAGTYNLSGGTLNVSTSAGPFFAGEFIGGFGSGTFVQSGGTNTVGTAAEFAAGMDNPLYLAFDGTSNSTQGVTGNYTLDSNSSTAVLTVYGDEAIGCGDTGNAETHTVSATGTFNQSGNTTNTISGKLSLGDQALGIGTYTLGSGSVVNVGGNEYVGNAGQGTFNQNGGNNNITGNLYVGNQAGSTGTFNLAGGNLSAASETVGNAGSGSIIQSDGTNTVGPAGRSSGQLFIGAGSGYTLYNSYPDTSTLAVNGALFVTGGGEFNLYGGSVTAISETVGQSNVGGSGAPAVVFQRDGSNTIGAAGSTSGILIVGNIGNVIENTNPVGNEYEMGLPTSQLTVNGNEFIGYNGVFQVYEQTSSIDDFDQTGGTHQVSGNLYLGYGASTTGTFELGDDDGDSSASLSVSGNEYVGYANIASQGSLGGSPYAVVAATSTFTQNPNTSHSVTGTLSIGDQAGSSGSYTLSGGSVAAGNEIVGNGGAGLFIQSGGTNTVGTAGSSSGQLTIGADSDYQLYNSGSSTSTLAVNGALSVTGGGYFLLNGGTITAGSEAVGQSNVGGSVAPANFFQQSGSNTIGAAGSTSGSLIVGNSGNVIESTSPSVGNEYSLGLPSSQLTVNGNEFIGYNGVFQIDETSPGQFITSSSTDDLNQVGSTHQVSGNLFLGYGDSTAGTFELGDETGDFSASLSVSGNEYIGYASVTTQGYARDGNPYAIVAAPSAFTQNVNTSHSVTGTLSIGDQVGSGGSYTLNGGSLTAGNEIVGNAGSGSFTQNGGTNNISAGSLTLAAQYGATSTYTLSGSSATTVTAGSEQIGPTGSPAAFVQQGGINTVLGGIANFNSFVVNLGSSYTLSGGTLNLASTRDSFNQGLFTLSGTGVLNGFLIESGQLIENNNGTYSNGLVINGGTVMATSDLFNENGIAMNGGAVEGTITNQATAPFTQSGGVVSGTINNYGSYSLQGSVSGSGNITGATLINGGTFYQFAGTTITGIASTSGTYSLFGGTYRRDAPAGSATVLSSGSFEQYGGTINCPTFLNQGNYIMNAGTFSSGSTFVNEGNFTYASGTYTSGMFNGSLVNYNDAAIYGLGLNVGNGIVNDGSLSFLSGTSLTLGGAIGLDNSGTVSLITDSTLTGTILNDYGGSFEVTGQSTIAGTFTNWGTLEIDPTLIVTGAVNNTGLISFASGKLLNAQGGFTNSGDLNLNQGAHLIGGAVVNNPGGEIVFGQANSTTVYGYSQSVNNAGGVIVINSDNLVTFSNFSGGNNAGGDIQIANNSTLTSGTAFPNSGTMELEGPNSALNGGAISNSGSITGEGRISNPVLNSGIVEAQGGTLQISGAGSTDLSGGQIIVASGSEVQYTQGLASNDGTIVLNGGTFDNNNRAMTNTGIINGTGTFRTGGTGLSNSSGGVIDVTAGTSFYGAVTNSGAMDLYGSTNYFYGNVTNASGGTIKVTNGSVYFLGNTGASVSGLYTSDPSDNYFNGLAITSTGTVTGGSGDQFSLMSGTTMTNAGKFTNDGVLSANAISNSGTFTQTGTLNESSNFINSGSATIGGIQNWAHGTTLTNTGGTTTLQSDASSTALYNLSVNITGGIALDSPQNWAGLNLVGSGTLDIGNEPVVVEYGSGPDPIASIAAWIASGFAGGAWNGTGIMSTIAQSNSGSYGIGYADSADPGNPAELAPGTIEVRYTLLGDANLDGKVNGTDFNILAANFNTGGDSWDQGDFTYDGKVNGSDFNLLAANFNQGATQAADFAALDSFAAANGLSLSADVPEPVSFALTEIGMGILLGRRRRAVS